MCPTVCVLHFGLSPLLGDKQLVSPQGTNIFHTRGGGQTILHLGGLQTCHVGDGGGDNDLDDEEGDVLL